MFKSIIIAFVCLCLAFTVACDNSEPQVEKNTKSDSSIVTKKMRDVPPDTSWYEGGEYFETHYYRSFDTVDHFFTTSTIFDSLTVGTITVHFSDSEIINMHADSSTEERLNQIYGRGWWINSVKDKSSGLIMRPHSDQDLRIFSKGETLPDTVDVPIEDKHTIEHYVPISTTELKVIVNSMSRYKSMLNLSEINENDIWIAKHKTIIEKMLKASIDPRLKEFGLLSPWKKETP